MRAYFFGCWNKPGHFLFSPGGKSVHGEVPANWHGRFDGVLAPRRMKRTGGVCWTGQAAGRDSDGTSMRKIEAHSDEMPQGRYLLHRIGGFTAMSWWDRTQGDGREGCNSTFLLEGSHDGAQMVAGLGAHFPHVLDNLRKAGVSLEEVPVPSQG